MRFVMFNLFLVCLLLFGISYLAFSHSETASDPHTHSVDNASWEAYFKTYHELLKTDPEAARLELQNVAKKLFGEHPLTKEWMELFFRMSRDAIEQDGIEHLSDFVLNAKRVYELEIQMLTDVDPIKYEKQIQQHQEALEYYAELAEFAESVGDALSVSKTETLGEQEDTSQSTPKLSDADKQEQIASQHFEKFLELFPTDPEAARKELASNFAILYQNHPLTSELTDLMFRLAREGEAEFSDIIRLTELQKQIQIDMDPVKYAEDIKRLDAELKQLKMIAKMYERDGRSEKIPFNLNPEAHKSEQKDELSASDSAHSPKIGEPAVDFQVIDLKGQELSLKKYRGHVVLLDFWATWCAPCRVEIPYIKKVYDKYKAQKFEVIGISLDQSKPVLNEYIEKHNITWPQVLDDGRAVAKMYNVTGIPATFLIDREGVIRRIRLRGNSLESAVAALVNGNLSKQIESDTSPDVVNIEQDVPYDMGVVKAGFEDYNAYLETDPERAYQRLDDAFREQYGDHPDVNILVQHIRDCNDGVATIDDAIENAEAMIRLISKLPTPPEAVEAIKVHLETLKDRKKFAIEQGLELKYKSRPVIGQ